MTGRELLEYVRDAGRDVETAHEVYCTIFARLTDGTSAPKAAVVKSSGGNGDDRLIALVNAADRERRAREDYSEAVELVQDLLPKLRDSRHRNDLEYRYLCGYTARKTAEKMHYGESWEREIHRQAVEAFERIYEAQKKEP
jgi:aspartokinase